MSPKEDPSRHVATIECRARRDAHRQGLTLSKSRRRTPRAIDYGTYHLSDHRNCIVAGSG